MQSGKAQVQEIGGHAAEDQKQSRPFNTWISNPGSIQMTFYSLSFITREGEGKEGLLTFFPWKEGAYLG